MNTRWAPLVLVVTVLLLQAASAATKQFSVLAIGDSFTEGWDPQTKAKTPYTDYLAPCLQQQTRNAVNIVVDNKGIGWSGVLMTGERDLTQHLVRVIAEAKGAGKKYNWAVLWVAGVNDVVNAKPPSPFPQSTAIGRYKQLMRMCLAQGWNVLVMPQPPFIFTTENGPKEVTRRNLAAALKASVLGAKNPRLRYLDISVALNGFKMSPAQRATVFSQNDHFSKIGYQKVGQLVCNFLAPAAKKV